VADGCSLPPAALLLGQLSTRPEIWGLRRSLYGQGREGWIEAQARDFREDRVGRRPASEPLENLKNAVSGLPGHRPAEFWEGT
jgi:hypothetical protein